ncbi:ribosome biogenesis GTPase-like protein Lsg1 [Sporormia fimetaria CBS 119925]|uniref:Ribosome biogenesis GTPase-like protein Lsg1 n=1 Tax=Sporormia fimetaria CBS 119925 TaxID=1340428 RepID=A0A6A6VIE0_9PLEO|nr:ribosome biogenesis GTPase-like protein Lsg1 [Sporormia fimetaria CBS 119925]
MVLAKSKKAVGLGNALMNDRFGKGKNSEMHRGNAQQEGIKRTNMDGETYVTNAKKEASWVKMRSVTEQGALDDFLSTAELAGTDFTAEKINNVKIIHKDQKNPYLLSAAEERAAIRKHKENKTRLTVPRRPHWDSRTTPQELDRRERDSLMQWRRGLAELQENNDLLMTPFERNLEVWRQLWRVIERSDLVVQIVDARNPLLFRSEDLEDYVKEVDSKKNNLLLVNKADMLTLEQRQAWADYFEKAGINFKFFSAELAKEMNEAKELEESSDDEEEDESEDEEAAQPASSSQDQSTPSEPTEAERTRILTTDELESLFLAHSPTIDPSAPRKTQIGLIGYPNVGKSSTINALLGAKKVSVSATPGKTKHFQTLHLSDQVVLCDCPGLVFPNFATTKAELVCSGVLPIDQLREYTGPATLVAQRIPQPFLDAIYGMKIQVRPAEEGGTGVPTGEELLRAYATARGFSTQGLGQPDESRAARFILKDYVKGKLLFCHPPPADPPIDAKHFNRELYDLQHLPAKRRANLAHLDPRHNPLSVAEASDMAGDEDADADIMALPVPQGAKTSRLDKKFFGPGSGVARVSLPFHEKYSEQGAKKELSGRKLKTMTALEKNVDPSELTMSSKKHFKGNKRRQKKVRSEYE